MGLPLVSAGLQTLTGLGQMIFSGRKKAERELNALKPPTYDGSKPISSYYQTALNRYYTPPTESAMYKRNVGNIMRSTATGLSALRGRGGAIAGVGQLVAGQNNAMLNTEALAEQEQNRRFGQLGQAVGMKAQDENQQFEINKLMPFNRTDRLKQMKLAAANARFDAGMNNTFGGLSGMSLLGGKKKQADTSLF